MKKYTFIRALFSPFKPFSLRLYTGKTQIGVPYFFPRKIVKDKKTGDRKFVPLTVGFSSCGLGWKTKWSNTDFRFEWSPVFSFVFFGYQIALTVYSPYADDYWESWLYYELITDKSKTKKERIEQCKKEFPRTYTIYRSDGEKETIDYYKLILKSKYL